MKRKNNLYDNIYKIENIQKHLMKFIEIPKIKEK